MPPTKKLEVEVLVFKETVVGLLQCVCVGGSGTRGGNHGDNCGVSVNIMRMCRLYNWYWGLRQETSQHLPSQYPPGQSCVLWWR